jgi:hypothetical protein
MPPAIAIDRATLERLLTLLARSYERTPMREVKQTMDTMRHLLDQAAPQEAQHPST